MQYFSTKRRSSPVAFRDAVLDGQPDDKGLYFPSEVPKLDHDLINKLRSLENGEIAFRVIRPYVGGSISDEVLREICDETVDFDFPLVEISERIFALELFHGPTFAFKDVGARFMSRCMRYFSKDRGEKTVVVVATSGDTGGAVASGFHNVEGVQVVILYPKGKVSRVQELQLTTFGGNVITLSVHGSFDDCQALAKHALLDADLRQKVFLTSANSINIARWLPQQFYFFFAMKQWNGRPPIVSVPSGNFGNLAAGMLAKRSGIPIDSFIAACNANDVVPEYLKTGKYIPKRSIETLSNAMDVGDPSNFVRILELYGTVPGQLRDELEAVSISDDRTRETMRDVYERFGYVLDPHGAVGYAALSDRLQNEPENAGLVLETAHPVKFDSVEQIIGNYLVIPETVRSLETAAKNSIDIDPEYQALKDIILSVT